MTATDSAENLANLHGVDLNRIRGSGTDGLITVGDVLELIESEKPIRSFRGTGDQNTATNQIRSANRGTRSIGAFYDFLKDRGYDPRWVGGDPKDGSRLYAQTMVCSHPLIRSIDFKSWEDSRPTGYGDSAGYEVRREYKNSFHVMAHYLRSSDLPEFSIRGGSLRLHETWVGNDMGSGIIDQLNIDELTKGNGKLTITARADRYLITYEWASPWQDEELGGATDWRTPSPELWGRLEAVAQHLLAPPAGRSTESADTAATQAMPAPRAIRAYMSGSSGRC